MREIKFRAWNTSKEVMYSADELGADQETLNVDGRGFINVSGDDTRLSQFHTHLLPLQYTGLKDKNGKEIYEGDILRQQLLGGNGLDEVPLPDEIFCGVVIWDFAGWSVDSMGDGRPEAGIYNNTILEVIGNIYENPELLKGETNERQGDKGKSPHQVQEQGR